MTIAIHEYPDVIRGSRGFFIRRWPQISQIFSETGFRTFSQNLRPSA
jgi:hypothetical protein